jgi:hypothetical protein
MSTIAGHGNMPIRSAEQSVPVGGHDRRHGPAAKRHGKPQGPKEEKMSELDKILNRIESLPGAEERISANVARMNKVLELEKLRKRKRLTQTAVGRRPGPSQRRVSAIENSSIEIQLDTEQVRRKSRWQAGNHSRHRR